MKFISFFFYSGHFALLTRDSRANKVIDFIPDGELLSTAGGVVFLLHQQNDLERFLLRC